MAELADRGGALLDGRLLVRARGVRRAEWGRRGRLLVLAHPLQPVVGEEAMHLPVLVSQPGDLRVARAQLCLLRAQQPLQLIKTRPAALGRPCRRPRALAEARRRGHRRGDVGATRLRRQRLLKLMVKHIKD
eukprot:6207901-Pleurochrysis_carterae.AAC.2